jgi:hypothetical protein
MPKFAYVKDGTVKHVQFLNEAVPVQEKWVAMNRSGVTIKESTNYNVMPGDLFLDGQFYKKEEDDSTTLLVEGRYTHPNSIRFAGIMDGEVVGQWGRPTEEFANQDEINDFIDNILTSEIIEVDNPDQLSAEVGWLYDGVNFTDPNND